jgi:hypothetical protein
MNPEALGQRANDSTWLGLLGRFAIALAIALGLYAATVKCLITPYVIKGSDAGRVAGVYEGYQRLEAHADRTRTLVLFWGSSMVREGVDCRLLEAISPQLTAFNFSVSGDIPSRRMVELPRVRELHPDCVVIGVSYPEIFESRDPFDDQVAVLPASAYRAMPAGARAMLDAKVTAIAGRSDWERFWWKRKYFFSAVCWKFGVPDRSNPIPPGYTDNLKTPFVYTKTIPQPELKNYLDSRSAYYPPYTSSDESRPGHSLSGRSLELIVSELEREGIRVKLVNMPLNPLLNAAIPAARRAALQTYLKGMASPAVMVFDYQEAVPAGDFIDLVHLNNLGRNAFTRMMASKLDGETHPSLVQLKQESRQ